MKNGILITFLMVVAIIPAYAEKNNPQSIQSKSKASFSQSDVSRFEVPQTDAPESISVKQSTAFTTTDIHGLLELGTNRVWRGISFSNRGPGVTGVILYDHPSGFYGGLIGINSSVSNSGIGVIPLIGYKGIKRKWEYDISARYEHYIKYNTRVVPDTSELFGKVGYAFSSFGKVFAGLGYSPNYYFRSETGWYGSGRLEFSLPQRFILDGGAAYQITKDGGEPGNLWFNNHWNWDAGIARDFIGVILGFRYTDTSLSRRECNGLLICAPAYNLYALKKF